MAGDLSPPARGGVGAAALLPAPSLPTHITFENTIMATKTITKTVHDGKPTRVADMQAAEWMAPSTRQPRLTQREEQIRAAHLKGAALDRIVSNHHVHPALLFRLLDMNPAEHADVFAELLDHFHNLQAKALR